MVVGIAKGGEDLGHDLYQFWRRISCRGMRAACASCSWASLVPLTLKVRFAALRPQGKTCVLLQVPILCTVHSHRVLRYPVCAGCSLGTHLIVRSGQRRRFAAWRDACHMQMEARTCGHKRVRSSGGSSIILHASRVFRRICPPRAGADSYFEGAELGSGCFGFTKILFHKVTGLPYAGKFIPLDKITEDVEREILNHRLLDHENIVRFHEVYTTSEYLVVVMELASEGELFGLLKHGALPEDVARVLFRQLISAIAYCHDNHVVHRDLKLENVLLHCERGGPMLLKIADFGFSKHALNHSTAHSFKGSIDYIAPEVISAGWCRQGSKYNGKLADIWSCGVILFLLVTGAYPFEATQTDSISKIKQNIITGAYRLPAHVSAECRDLIQRILRLEPQQRIDIAQIRHHAWFSQGPPEAPRAPRLPRAPSQDEDAIRSVLSQAVDSHQQPLEFQPL